MHAYVAAVFITWRHLPPSSGERIARLTSWREIGVGLQVCSFVRSFVRGDGDRGSWSPWLPWRGFDGGVWGIDAASSVASGGLRSFGFPSPSGGGVQQVGLPYRVAGSIGDQLDTSCDTYRSGILPSLRGLTRPRLRTLSQTIGIVPLTFIKNHEVYNASVILWSKRFWIPYMFRLYFDSIILDDYKNFCYFINFK